MRDAKTSITPEKFERPVQTQMAVIVDWHVLSLDAGGSTLVLYKIDSSSSPQPRVSLLSPG
jgi:hypothetical protein